MNVIRVDIVGFDERGHALFDARNWQAIGRVNARNPRDRHAPPASHARRAQLPLRRNAPSRTLVLRPRRMCFVDPRAGAVAVHAGRAGVDEARARPGPPLRGRAKAVGYNERRFSGSIRMQPVSLCAARHRAARAAQRGNQRARATVGIAVALRRREMQHVAREAREPSEAAAQVEITGNRRGAGRAQLARALRMMRERDDAGRAGTRMQKRQRAHADIAAPDDQDTRAAKVSSGDHPGILSVARNPRAASNKMNETTPHIAEIDLWLST
ncbi:protein of unknown function [Caballeronia sp. S22]